MPYGLSNLPQRMFEESTKKINAISIHVSNNLPIHQTIPRNLEK